jgi:hypothetical protein
MHDLNSCSLLAKKRQNMKQDNPFNVTDPDKWWKQFRRILNTPTGLLAWISIVLNIFVIATFLKIRKSKRKLPQAALQLFILAISEATASLYWALGLVYCLLRENSFLSKNDISSLVLLSYGFICINVSRTLTLFITGEFHYQGDAKWIIIRLSLGVIMIRPLGGQPPASLLAA